VVAVAASQFSGCAGSINPCYQHPGKLLTTTTTTAGAAAAAAAA